MYILPFFAQRGAEIQYIVEDVSHMFPDFFSLSNPFWCSLYSKTYRAIICFFFFSSHFQWAFIISYTMIQDPRVGISMYPGPPSPPWGEGRRTEDRGGGMEPVQIFPGNVPSAWRSSQVDTQDVEQRDLYTRRYRSHTETSPPLAVIAFSQRWKSR